MHYKLPIALNIAAIYCSFLPRVTWTWLRTVDQCKRNTDRNTFYCQIK